MAELLRFLACGSVDDGKSTLIGRLLHDADLIHDDQLPAVRDNLALVVDGLKAEREEGITIDVAWRYVATARRSSSSPIRRDTTSTRAVWPPAPRDAIWR